MDPHPIIGHSDGFKTSSLAGDVDLECIGVEAVFEEFFDDADWSLDYFAGGNAVDYCFGEGADLWSGAAAAT